jgi:CBS domain-containing membrane protein
MSRKSKLFARRFQVSEDDIYEAMKDISGYLDITPGDLKEIYLHAYQHAIERIRTSVTASDLMTGDVLTVSRQTPLGDVAELMARHGISGLPVIDEERHVVGVLSEKDFRLNMGENGSNSLMRLISDCIRCRECAAMTIRGKTAQDIMTSPAITVREDVVVGEIASLLSDKGINRVPVVDNRGCLVGIVSRADIVRISIAVPPRPSAPPRDETW